MSEVQEQIKESIDEADLHKEVEEEKYSYNEIMLGLIMRELPGVRLLFPKIKPGETIEDLGELRAVNDSDFHDKIA